MTVTRTLVDDKKLAAIFQPSYSQAQIRAAIESHHLKGQALTLLMDKVSRNSKISFMLDSNNRIKSMKVDEKEIKNVVKLSIVPFWIRLVFHKLRMKSDGYRQRFEKKAELLASKFYLAKMDVNLDKLDEVTPELEAIKTELMQVQKAKFAFTNRALRPPGPQTFKGNVLSKWEVQQLLNNHKDIFDKEGIGTHGSPYVNINEAYDQGVNILSFDKNIEFITKVKQVLTLISQRNSVNQSALMRTLIQGFKGCRPGRIDTTNQLLDKLLSVDLGFEGQVEAKFHRFKVWVLERLIRKNHPECSQANAPKHLQFAHLKSGYILAMADDFGLKGKDAAAADQNHCRVDELCRVDKRFILSTLKTQYRKCINEGFEEFCADIAQEANAPYQDPTMCDITTMKLYQWIGEKCQNKELSDRFGRYEKFKKELYREDATPTDDQTDQIQPFLAVSEVKQMLETLGFANRSS